MSMRKALAQEPTGTMYDEQERQKLLRLNREKLEPQEPRLEWIYTGDRTKSEDFLLGRKLDGDIPPDEPSDDNATTSTIDLANKIREDPLYLIKKKEIEQKKRILENPVRLKQLKELLERQESGKSGSSSRKKHHHSRSRSPQERRGSRSQHRRRHSPSSQSRSAHSHREHSPPRRERTPPRPSTKHHEKPPKEELAKSREKQSKEDRDRRIREMLVDGAMRNEQRQQNVRLYKEFDDREEKVNEIIKQRAKKRNDLSSSEDEEQDFIRPMMKQIVDDPSLKRRDLKHHHHHHKRR
ncbi:unnamed protein product [Rotaria magnacalcarata]|uniref:Uncharacterized protein n=4 Tax=Rotaria magnacalcarata TaxID=392030 RepID=A0A819BB22_9BILA|nr:unnamed protein product [Rotaria magnacalcarata]CAF3798045.1 unnamed protein product [Rotaria magnacalcarata]